MPTPSKSQVNRAGEFLRRFTEDQIEGVDDLADLLDAFDVVAEYRQGHALPLGLVTTALAAILGELDSSRIVAQRLKRMPQIVRKLKRHRGMKLARMQDVAGCRAVLPDEFSVERVADAIDRKWTVARSFDYRGGGKPETGYRGLHLVVEQASPDDGQKRAVEIQLRTAAEHGWAVAVERTAGRTGFELKDGLGPKELVEYFNIASEVIKARQHGRPDPVSEDRLRNLRPRAARVAREAVA